MGIPYTFQNQTGPIPLSELDANFTATRTDLANTSNPALGTGLVGWFKSLANFVGRTLSAKLADQYSVCDYGAVGDGATNNATFLANCPATDLLVPPGTYLVNSNTTIVANLRFAAGAVLKPASGTTLALSNSFVAPISQIFDLSLGGTVAVSQKTTTAYPEWWGAKGDGVADDTAAIQAALYSGAQEIYLGAKAYLTDTIYVPNSVSYAMPSGGRLYASHWTILTQKNSANPLIAKQQTAGRIFNWTIGPLSVQPAAGGSSVGLINCSGFTSSTFEHTYGVSLDRKSTRLISSHHSISYAVS